MLLEILICCYALLSNFLIFSDILSNRSLLFQPLAACAKNATASVSSATRTCVRVPWSGSAMNATTDRIKDDVSSVEDPVSRMPTTARSARSRRRTETAVQRLLTWDHRRRTCSTSERSTASSRSNMGFYSVYGNQIKS